jgi:hypothetical protein
MVFNGLLVSANPDHWTGSKGIDWVGSALGIGVGLGLIVFILGLLLLSGPGRRFLCCS